MKPIHHVLSAVAVMAGVGAVSSPARATDPSPGLFKNEPLASGLDFSDGTIPLQVGTDVVMARITVQPLGYSGWHSHPGGAIIVVAEGTATVYRSIGSQCQKSTYSEGQAFLEGPGELDQVVNESETNEYVLYVTFPRVPVGSSARISEDNPGTCPDAP